MILGKNVLRINNGDDLYEELHFLSEFEVKSYDNASGMLTYYY